MRPIAKVKATASAIAVMIVVAMLGTLCAPGGTAAGAVEAAPALDRRCDWPTWGYSIERTFATQCPTELTEANVSKLRLRWFFNTRDVVNTTPVLVNGRLYVGDWSGRFYALRASDGRKLWTFDAKIHPTVYAGQIVGSATVARVGGVRTVFFPAGKTMYALRASDGKLRWRHEVGRKGDPKDPTEIESSPLVVNGMVLFGTDVHNSGKGEPAGLYALDARTGKQRWMLTTAPSSGVGATGEGATGSGCGDIWSSPTVDKTRGLVFIGTGNCPDPKNWGRFSDTLFAADLATGTLKWTFQPHDQNNDDLDFAGAPNLIEVNGRALVGLGNKDGTYYLADRETGAEAGAIKATGPGLTRPGSNFSTGGFIGPTAYDAEQQIVVGGTAVGPAPYLHGINVADNTIAWQNQEPSATYAPTAIANGIAFVGGTDFTFRALRVSDGKSLWEHPMKGAVSGGAAITRSDVFTVAGIREPGLDQRSRTSGVYRFSLTGKKATIRIPIPKTTTTTKGSTAEPQSCIDSQCTIPFDLKTPPAGLSPVITLDIDEKPFKVTVTATDLGTPSGWLRPGTSAAKTGASMFGVFMSERDDNPSGGLICALAPQPDGSLACTGNKIPRKGVTYNRISILAVNSTKKMPSPGDGFERLVATRSFSPPISPTK